MLRWRLRSFENWKRMPRQISRAHEKGRSCFCLRWRLCGRFLSLRSGVPHINTSVSLTSIDIAWRILSCNMGKAFGKRGVGSLPKVSSPSSDALIWTTWVDSVRYEWIFLRSLSYLGADSLCSLLWIMWIWRWRFSHNSGKCGWTEMRVECWRIKMCW